MSRTKHEKHKNKVNRKITQQLNQFEQNKQSKEVNTSFANRVVGQKLDINSYWSLFVVMLYASSFVQAEQDKNGSTNTKNKESTRNSQNNTNLSHYQTQDDGNTTHVTTNSTSAISTYLTNNSVQNVTENRISIQNSNISSPSVHSNLKKNPSFFSNNCLQVVNPNGNHRKLVAAINEQIHNIERSTNNSNACKYPLKNFPGHYIFLFTDQNNQTHYFLLSTTKEAKLGKESAGIAWKACPLEKEKNGKWNTTSEVRAVKETNFNLTDFALEELKNDRSLLTQYPSLKEAIYNLKELYFDEICRNISNWVNKIGGGSKGVCKEEEPENVQAFDMPFVSGNTFEKTDFSRLSLLEKIRIACQLFDQVSCMHDLFDVTHGDLHHKNIMYDDKIGKAEIIDLYMDFIDKSSIDSQINGKKDISLIVTHLKRIFQNEVGEIAEQINIFLDDTHNLTAQECDFFEKLRNKIEREKSYEVVKKN